MNESTLTILKLTERLADMTARAEQAEASVARLGQINAMLTARCQEYERRPSVVQCDEREACIHVCPHGGHHVRDDACDSMGCNISGSETCRCVQVES